MKEVLQKCNTTGRIQLQIKKSSRLRLKYGLFHMKNNKDAIGLLDRIKTFFEVWNN